MNLKSKLASAAALALLSGAGVVAVAAAAPASAAVTHTARPTVVRYDIEGDSGLFLNKPGTGQTVTLVNPGSAAGYQRQNCTVESNGQTYCQYESVDGNCLQGESDYDLHSQNCDTSKPSQFFWYTAKDALINLYLSGLSGNNQGVYGLNPQVVGEQIIFGLFEDYDSQQWVLS